jgi:hypothetical protein
MGYFLQKDNSYYEGDRAHPLDQEVPQRPDFTYNWDGVKWIQNSLKITKPAKTKQEREDEIDALTTIADIKIYLKTELK